MTLTKCLREQFCSGITANWKMLGLSSFGTVVSGQNTEQPYHYTHQLCASLHPINGYFFSLSTAVKVNEDASKFRSE
jgi:hypothetical protein